MNHRQALEQAENEYDDNKRFINQQLDQVNEKKDEFHRYLDSLGEGLYYIQQNVPEYSLPSADLEETRYESQQLFDRVENELQEEAEQNRRNFYAKQEDIERAMQQKRMKGDER